MLKEIEINAIERDILREVLNIGLAKAADSLAAISKDTVLLNVPEIQIINPTMINPIIEEKFESDIIVVTDLKGDLHGKTILVYPKQQADRLSEVCIGKQEDFTGNYIALKRSLLLEVGNILTGALITQLANFFQMHIYCSPPKTFGLQQKKEFLNLDTQFKPFLLTITTRFINAGHDIEMPLIIILEFEAVQKIVQIIRTKKKTNVRWLVL